MRSLWFHGVRSGMVILCCSLAATARPGAEEEKKDAPAAEPPGSKPAGKGETKGAAEKKGSEKAGPEKAGTEKKAGDKKAADKKSEKAEAAKAAEAADIQLVKDGLKEFIHGTVSFDEKNVVTIEYAFKLRNDEFERDFTPPINPRIPANFRWSSREEESYSTGDAGIRISDSGAAVLNLWWKDDVEATMEYLNAIGWSRSQVCAIVFQARNGQAVGNNFGGQCAMFAGGAFKGGVPPTTEQLTAEKRAKFTLRMKDGTFESLLNGKSKKTSKYSPKSLASGRVGFVWGGKLAGTITSLTIKGTLDFTATAKEMRKPAPR